MKVLRSLSRTSNFFIKPKLPRSNVYRRFLCVPSVIRPLSQAVNDTATINLSDTQHRPPFEQRATSKWSVYGPFPEEIDAQKAQPDHRHKRSDGIRIESRNCEESPSESSPKVDSNFRGNHHPVSLEKPLPIEKLESDEALEVRYGSTIKKKKKSHFVCESCGHTDGQWWGMCRSCGEAGSMNEFYEHTDSNEVSAGIQASENALKSWVPTKKGERPLKLTDVNRGMSQLQWRIPLTGEFGCEVDRVIGGGLVPGSLILVGGDPGVGKSTLLLQIAAAIAKQCPREDSSVVYVSGEESVEQIGNRAERMKIQAENLFLYSSIEIEDILEKIQPLSPRTLIIDSIQTVYLRGVVGSPGSVAQVKECSSALLRFAKRTNVTVILIGHVTKSGEIAGPRVLEHIVDVVLYMEGEKSCNHRLLRPVKNRFGSIDELGVFEMAPMGLKPITSPCEMFLRPQFADSEVLAGLAVAVMMDGSRSFLIEIQALCATGATVSRHVNGISMSKADMIISVLTKQAGLMLPQNSVFLNVVGGVTLTETSGDLAIAAAICSSYLEYPIPSNVAFVGEIGLGGEIRPVPRMDRRLTTLWKMGFKKCIVGKLGLECDGFEGMEVVGCMNLKEVISFVFK